MQKSEVRDLKITEVPDNDPDSPLPFRVEIIGDNGSVHGAGATLAKALLAAFSVSGMIQQEFEEFSAELPEGCQWTSLGEEEEEEEQAK